MALPLWGELEKSVDDPETIEEAIARLILAHNEDSESHLGSGQSLEAHKAEEIIDHPAGSVLADKMTMTEMDFYTMFESLDSWTHSGLVFNDSWPGLHIDGNDGGSNTAYIFSDQGFPESFFNLDFTMLLEFYSRLSSPSNVEIFIGSFNLNPTLLNFRGIGFYYSDNIVYGVISDGTTRLQTSSLGVDTSLNHVYRAYYDQDTKLVTFFVDGFEIVSLDASSLSGSDSLAFQAYLKTSDSSSTICFIYSLRFSQNLIES